MATAMNSSSSSSSTEVTTVKLNLPPSLVFLISNIHSFVTIKLDSHNYVIWRTQIEHALKANNFFGYVDGTISCPSATTVRTTEISVSDPDIALWKIIDSQLVSCLIATISATTLPLILGLEHAYQVWAILEQRFNSVSRTHVHDLKRQLYNISKTSTLEAYFDSIKQLSYKLAAAGAPVTEEDLIFYTLHGLPSEFDGLQTALSARLGDISFEELITIINGEEMRKNRSSSVNPSASTSVFVTTPQPNILGSFTSSNTPQQQQFQSQSQSQNLPQVIPSQQQPPMFVAPYPQQFNNSRNQNKPRGFKYQKNGPRAPCQICDKTNHTAKTCYHRLDMQYQPPYQSSYHSSMTSPHYSQPHYPQAHMLQYPSSIPYQPPVLPYQPPAVPPSPFHTGLLPTPQVNFSPIQPFTYPYSSSLYPSHYPSHPASSSSCPSSSSVPHPVPSPTSANWFLDSGATNHVTNELSNLSIQHPYTGTTGVMVGNGNTLPISHTGQNHQQDFASGAFSSGPISNSALF